MLIRFVVDNVFSFGAQKEFNMVPNARIRVLPHHKYKFGDTFNFLKMSSIYGANGAGKSNLIKALSLLQLMVRDAVSPSLFGETKFKLQNMKSRYQT